MRRPSKKLLLLICLFAVACAGKATPQPTPLPTADTSLPPAEPAGDAVAEPAWVEFQNVTYGARSPATRIAGVWTATVHWTGTVGAQGYLRTGRHDGSGSVLPPSYMYINGGYDTSTSLAGSTSAAFLGQPVTFTATVSASGTAKVPTGYVRFLYFGDIEISGCGAQPLTNEQATCTAWFPAGRR